MSEPWINAVLIIPTAHKQTADLGSVAMGHTDPGVETYTVPLSPTGAEPATHWACVSWVRQAFLDTVEDAKGGKLPDGVPWDAVKLTEADVLAMADALIVRDIEDGKHHGHFGTVCDELGLAPIVVDIDP
jgi:hypothetical protein